MDRFIVSTAVLMKTIVSNLKSNMDRFIVVINKCTIECMRNLKSNMDRFIVNLNCDVILSDII